MSGLRAVVHLATKAIRQGLQKLADRNSQIGCAMLTPAEGAKDGMTTHAEQARGYAERWSAGATASRDAVARNGAHTPIDHAHLARYTLGDRALELEILDLFLDEAPRTLNRLKDLAATCPCDPKDWIAGCHTLKGSARAVGAAEVAAAAERGEREAALTPDRLDGHVVAMAAALAAVTAYISYWRQKV